MVPATVRRGRPSRDMLIERARHRQHEQPEADGTDDATDDGPEDNSEDGPEDGPEDGVIGLPDESVAQAQEVSNASCDSSESAEGVA